MSGILAFLKKHRSFLNGSNSLLQPVSLETDVDGQLKLWLEQVNMEMFGFFFFCISLCIWIYFKE